MSYALRLLTLFSILSALAASPVSAENKHAQSAFASSPISLDFPADREWVEVPFRLDMTKIVVPLSINGSEPVEAVLDTGASSALLMDHEVAASIDFDIVGEAQVQGAGHGGEMPKVEVARGVRFGLGDLTLENANLAVMRGANPMAKKDWQAIIGRQIFESLVVQVDWEKEVLRFADPKRFTAPKQAAALPIERKNGHIFVDGEVAVADGPGQKVQLVVDSGAFHALSLDTRKLEAQPQKRLEGIKLGRGLSGVIKGAAGRIERLKIGDFTFEKVLTYFPEASYADIISSRSHGNLGAEVLRRFLVTFDYSRSQMLLEPNNALAEAFEFSTAGFSFFPALSDDGAGLVDDLYADSPAAAAGLQEGDEILSIDGRRLADLGLEEARRRLRQSPGTRLELEIRREGKIFSAGLVLAEIL